MNTCRTNNNFFCDLLLLEKSGKLGIQKTQKNCFFISFMIILFIILFIILLTSSKTMSSNTKTIINAYEAKLEANRIKQAAEGERKVSILLSADAATENSLLNIVSDGMKDFEKEFNRPMTYAEMRERFG
jgi:hypothetical protein